MAKETLKTRTWNIQSVRGEGELQLLHNEIKPCNCNILGLVEMQWEGESELNNGELIWSSNDNNDQRSTIEHLSHSYMLQALQ